MVGRGLRPDDGAIRGNVPYCGSGVSVNVPGFYARRFGALPAYGVGTYGYPGTTVYGTGYSGYVTPGAGFVGGGAYIPMTRVYSYGNGNPGYYYGPYRRGLFGGRCTAGLLVVNRQGS